MKKDDPYLNLVCREIKKVLDAAPNLDLLFNTSHWPAFIPSPSTMAISEFARSVIPYSRLTVDECEREIVYGSMSCNIIETSCSITPHGQIIITARVISPDFINVSMQRQAYHLRNEQWRRMLGGHIEFSVGHAGYAMLTIACETRSGFCLNAPPREMLIDKDAFRKMVYAAIAHHTFSREVTKSIKVQL